MKKLATPSIGYAEYISELTSVGYFDNGFFALTPDYYANIRTEFENLFNTVCGLLPANNGGDVMRKTADEVAYLSKMIFPVYTDAYEVTVL